MSVEDDVAMICRQTTYTREEALEKLEMLKDTVKVIQTYMVPCSIKKAERNTQQMIYDQLSKFVEETSQQQIKR